MRLKQGGRDGRRDGGGAIDEGLLARSLPELSVPVQHAGSEGAGVGRRWLNGGLG